jgi:lysozyme family protein
MRESPGDGGGGTRWFVSVATQQAEGVGLSRASLIICYLTLHSNYAAAALPVALPAAAAAAVAAGAANQGQSHTAVILQVPHQVPHQRSDRPAAAAHPAVTGRLLTSAA